jgi:predicted RNA-binding protein with PIN domain
MEFDWLIIDGYNLLHQDDALANTLGDFQDARRRLVRRIECAAIEMASHTTVVFDGREDGIDTALSAPHLEVVFSPANRTADGVIERMVASSSAPGKICVVTSDRVEEQIVSSAGASVLSCEFFIHRINAAERPDVSRRNARRNPSGSTLGDFFPESSK